MKARVTYDPLVSFLYSLLRDHLPAGDIEHLTVDAIAPITLTNGYLAQYAEDIARRLRPRAAIETLECACTCGTSDSDDPADPHGNVRKESEHAVLQLVSQNADYLLAIGFSLRLRYPSPSLPGDCAVHPTMFQNFDPFNSGFWLRVLIISVLLIMLMLSIGVMIGRYVF